MELGISIQVLLIRRYGFQYIPLLNVVSYSNVTPYNQQDHQSPNSDMEGEGEGNPLVRGG